MWLSLGMGSWRIHMGMCSTYLTVVVGGSMLFNLIGRDDNPVSLPCSYRCTLHPRDIDATVAGC